MPKQILDSPSTYIEISIVLPILWVDSKGIWEVSTPSSRYRLLPWALVHIRFPSLTINITSTVRAQHADFKPCELFLEVLKGHPITQRKHLNWSDLHVQLQSNSKLLRHQRYDQMSWEDLMQMWQTIWCWLAYFPYHTCYVVSRRPLYHSI